MKIEDKGNYTKYNFNDELCGPVVNNNFRYQNDYNLSADVKSIYINGILIMNNTFK